MDQQLEQGNTEQEEDHQQGSHILYTWTLSTHPQLDPLLPIPYSASVKKYRLTRALATRKKRLIQI